MTKKKTKQIHGELIYGIHPVIEALKAKRRKFIAIYTTKPTPRAWAQIEKVLPKYPFNIQYVSRDILNRMAGTNDHQGVIGWVQAFPLRKKFFNPAKAPCLVMLDGIQDVGNVGAIVRSAYCTNFDGVILTKKNGAPLNAQAIKASAGLAEHLEIYIAPSAQAAMQELKTAGYNCYLATFDGQNAVSCEYTKPLCLIVGSEGSGVSREILKEGTHVTLPQKNSAISYNASVAAGLLIFTVATKLDRL